MTAEADRISAEQVVEGLLATFLPGAQRLRGGPQLDDRPFPMPMDFDMKDGEVTVASFASLQLVPALPRAARYALPQLWGQSSTVRLLHLLQWFHRRPSCSVAYGSLLYLVGLEIEKAILARSWGDATHQDLAGKQVYRHRKDPGLRMSVLRHNMMVARQKAKHGKAAPVVKKQPKTKRVQVYDGDMRATLYRYWLASVRDFSNVVDVALTCDSARFGGQEHMSACLMNLDSGICCWGPAQASERGVLVQRETRA